MYQFLSPQVKKAGDAFLLPTPGLVQQPQLAGLELMETVRVERLQVFVHTSHCGIKSPRWCEQPRGQSHSV